MKKNYLFKGIFIWSFAFFLFFLSWQVKAQIPVYGIDNANTQLVSFNVNDPTSSTDLGDSSVPEDDFENAGSIDPDNPNTAYVLAGEGDLFSVNLTTGVYTSLGEITPSGDETWAGMAFDPTDGTLYALSTDINNSTSLYSIDVDNLSSTEKGTTDMEGGIALAIDDDGNMYALDISADEFVSVDKSDGSSTTIGDIGFTANYGQGMCWDPNTKHVFMAAENDDTQDAEWRSVDLATGETNLIGTINEQTGWASIADVITDCSVPQDLAVDDVTETTLDLSWTAGDSETDFTVKYAVGDFDPYTEGESKSVTGSTSTTLTELEPGKTYTIYIKADCDQSESPYNLPVTGTLDCGTNSVPYTINFEFIDPPNLPNCTSKENNGAGNAWETENQTDYGFNGNVLSYSFSSGNAADAWFFTNAINLEADTDYRISYKYGHNSSSTTEKLRVANGDAPTASAMNDTLAEYPNIDFKGNEDDYVIFTPDSDGEYNFGFQVYSESNQYYLYVDNITVEVAPTCFEVEQDSISVDDLTSSSADISWSEGMSGEDEWNVIYGEAGFDPDEAGTTENLTDSSFTIAGLDPNTEYDFYIQAVCSDSDSSPVSDVESFTTLCETTNVPFTQDFESVTPPEIPNCAQVENNGGGNAWETENETDYGFDSNVLSYSYSYSGAADTWFFTQGIELTAGTDYRISYKYGHNSTISVEKMRIAVGQTPTATAMNDTLNEYPSIDFVGNETDDAIFTPDSDGAYYFGFQAYSESGQYYLYVDDIEVIEAPSCLEVEQDSISVDDLTTTTADISWSQGISGEDEWNLIYGEAGFDPDQAGTTENLTDSSFTISGLDPDTVYDFYIQAVCSDSDSSPLSNVENFRTLCESTTVPYTQDFEAITPPEIPSCANVVNNGSGNEWETENETDYGFDSNVLSYSYDFSNAADSWFFTQGIELTAGTDYRLSYKYGHNTSTTTEKLRIGAGTAQMATEMNDTLVEYPNINTEGSQEDDVIFTPESDGVYYFGFQVYSESGQYYLFVDDIELIVAPTCLEIDDESVSIDELTTSSADVSWSQGPSAEDEWKITYGEEGFDPESEGTTEDVSTPSFSIPGLDPNTVYEFYIKSVCSDSDSSPYKGPFSFRTACEAFDDFFEDFDDTNTEEVPECWSTIVNGGGEANVNGFGANSDPNYFRLYSSGDADAEVYLITPMLNALSEDTHRMRFSAENGAFDDPEMTLEIGTMSNPTDDATFEVYDTIAISDGYEEYEEYFTQGTTDDYVAFRATFTGTYDGVYLDDIYWEVIPDCPIPLNVEISDININEATVTWDDVFDDQNFTYDIAYGEAGFTPTEPDAQDVTSPYTIDELDAQVNYEVYVRNNCDGGSETSEWIGPVSFTTALQPIPVIPGEPAQDTTYCYGNSEEKKFLYQSTDGESITISFDGGNVEEDVDNISIYDGITENGDLLYDSDVDGPDLTGVELEGTSGSIYMVITSDIVNSCEGSYEEVEILPFDWEVISTASQGTCYTPVDVVIDEFDENSVSISWNDDANDTDTWEVVYGEAGFDPENGGTTITVDDGNPSLMISDLLDDTAYDIYVRSICDSDNSSEFSTVRSFTTEVFECVEPSGIEVNDISTFSAEVTFTENGDVNEWTVVYGPEGFDPETEGQSVVADDGFLGVVIDDLTQNTTYEVYVYANCTEDDTSEMVGPVAFTTDATAGVSASELGEFKYYPNPTSGQLNLSSTMQIDKVELFDLNGKVIDVRQPQMSDYQLDFSDLSSGVYLMKVEVDGKTGTFRVVRE